MWAPCACACACGPWGAVHLGLCLCCCYCRCLKSNTLHTHSNSFSHKVLYPATYQHNVKQGTLFKITCHYASHILGILRRSTAKRIPTTTGTSICATFVLIIKLTCNRDTVDHKAVTHSSHSRPTMVSSHNMDSRSVSRMNL